jgi:LysR family glycine cleavage system transcriptional activator
MMRLPPLNAVRAFDAAGRHLSISRAAEELCVTHGAVSRHVKALEEWLGIRLFQRVWHGVELTDGGRSYLAAVSPAISAIATASLNVSGKNVLRVNTLPTFTMRWLLPRLLSFRNAHPDIDIELSTGLETVAQLPSTIDIIIRRELDPVPGLVKRRFIGEFHFPVCSPALLRDRKIESVDDLSQHTLLHCTARPKAWEEWLSRFSTSSIIPARSLHLEHLYFCLQAAIDGVGVAMGTSSLIAEDIVSERLVRPFGGRVSPYGSYFIIIREERKDDAAVAAFCDWMESEGRTFESNHVSGAP